MLSMFLSTKTSNISWPTRQRGARLAREDVPLSPMTDVGATSAAERRCEGRPARPSLNFRSLRTILLPA
jgi:hypothetical protein